VEVADDWEWQEIAGQLYVWIDRFNDRFFGREMPEAVLSFERIDYRVLAAYTLRRNPQGLLYEITLNTRYLTRPLWQTLETLMHEYVHLWQQNAGAHPVSHNYHNQEFVARCEALSLHPLIGRSVAMCGRPTAPSPSFSGAYGVDEPAPLAEPRVTPKGKPLDWWSSRRKRKGQSTLRKWKLRLPRTCESAPANSTPSVSNVAIFSCLSMRMMQKLAHRRRRNHAMPIPRRGGYKGNWSGLRHEPP
jgi:hypothetical protein